MPTPTKGTRLGGSPAHEKLILSNLATSLFEHGAITTTAAKAKRLQPLAESMITKAKRGDLNSRRQVMKRIRDKSVVHVLFTEIGERYADRPGGYTRITKLGPRKGDNAPMVKIELVEAMADSPKAKKAAAKKAPGARRPRRRREAAAGDETAETTEADGRGDRGRGPWPQGRRRRRRGSDIRARGPMKPHRRLAEVRQTEAEVGSSTEEAAEAAGSPRPARPRTSNSSACQLPAPLRSIEGAQGRCLRVDCPVRWRIDLRYDGTGFPRLGPSGRPQDRAGDPGAGPAAPYCGFRSRRRSPVPAGPTPASTRAARWSTCELPPRRTAHGTCSAGSTAYCLRTCG